MARLRVPRLLTGILLAAAVAVAVAGLASRPQRVREMEQAGREAAGLLERARELLERHPDYPFLETRRSLAAYTRLSARRRGKDLPAIRRLLEELERAAVSQATGRPPGGPGWSEVLRYKTFSPNGFRGLYEALSPGTPGTMEEAPPVTGMAEADRRIASLAQARGYRLRAQADPGLLADAGGGRLLQPAVLRAFQGLQAEAAAQGLSLELVSGFRTVARQRVLFLAALGEQSRRRLGRRLTPVEIAEGAADEALEAALAQSAPPGFSRHHTGYALDLNDSSTGRPFTEFGGSRADRWLAADNYLAAKRFGFIPSYPPGADAQGPDPEPWEYVWVGEAALGEGGL